jgi:hypothetical protein
MQALASNIQDGVNADKSLFFSPAHIHPTPGPDPLSRCRITAGQQDRKLVGLQGFGRRGGALRPPREPPLREPLLAQPKALPII